MIFCCFAAIKFSITIVPTSAYLYHTLWPLFTLVSGGQIWNAVSFSSVQNGSDCLQVDRPAGPRAISALSLACIRSAGGESIYYWSAVDSFGMLHRGTKLVGNETGSPWQNVGVPYDRT